MGKRVVVLGGGNVAFDCARVARRLGAEEVHIACLECRDGDAGRRRRDTAGGGRGHRHQALQTSTRILADGGRVTGVEFLDVETFCFDEDNIPQIESIPGSEHVIEADTVIFAVGQFPEIPEGFGLDLTDRGFVEIDLSALSTNREAVFATGDVVSGTSSVIKAIASGRKAATAVDKYLGGSGRIDRKLAPQAEPDLRSAGTRASPGWPAWPRLRHPGGADGNFCEVMRGTGGRGGRRRGGPLPAMRP